MFVWREASPGQWTRIYEYLTSNTYIHTHCRGKQVFVWREASPGQWTRIYEYADHKSSVNSISFAPHEQGLRLACASADGTLSVLTWRGSGTALRVFVCLRACACAYVGCCFNSYFLHTHTHTYTYKYTQTHTQRTTAGTSAQSPTRTKSAATPCLGRLRLPTPTGLRLQHALFLVDVTA